MIRTLAIAAVATLLATPAFAQNASPAPGHMMKGDHMSGHMKGDHMTGHMMKNGHAMAGHAMKGDHMAGHSMKGDHMAGHSMKGSAPAPAAT